MKDPRFIMGEDILKLKLFSEYLPRLFDSYFTLTFSYMALDQNREKLVAHLTSGVPDLLDELKRKGAWKAGESHEADVVAQMQEMNRKNVDNYLENLINLTVVLMCSSLEIAINNIVLTIFTAKPETLCGIEKDKQLAVREVIEAGDYQNLMERLRDQKLASFGREKIGKKFGILGRDFGINQDRVFEDKSGLGKLEGIFEKRNAIIHHGSRPFTQSVEVEETMPFFQKILFSLCFEVSRVYLIPVDFLGYYAAWMPQPPSGSQQA